MTLGRAVPPQQMGVAGRVPRQKEGSARSAPKGGDSGLGTEAPSLPGNNMLLVGVHGPRTPCEEILVKHVGSRLYSVSYLLKDKGEYTLVVKWGDEHVPGSPYRVLVP